MNPRFQVAGASCAFVFVVLLFAGLILTGFIPPVAPSLSAEKVAAVYRGNSAGIKAGLVLMMFGAAVTAPFIAAVSALIRRIDERLAVLASTQLIAGTAGIAAIFVPVMLFCGAAYRPERPAEITMALNDLAWIPFIMNGGPAIVQTVVIGVAILCDRRTVPLVPRWAAYFNFWTAFLFLPACILIFFRSGPFAWNGLLSFWVAAAAFGSWFLVMGWLLIRAARRTDEASAASVLTFEEAR